VKKWWVLLSLFALFSSGWKAEFPQVPAGYDATFSNSVKGEFSAGWGKKNGLIPYALIWNGLGIHAILDVGKESYTNAVSAEGTTVGKYRPNRKFHAFIYSVDSRFFLDIHPLQYDESEGRAIDGWKVLLDGWSVDKRDTLLFDVSRGTYEQIENAYGNFQIGNSYAYNPLTGEEVVGGTVLMGDKIPVAFLWYRSPFYPFWQQINMNPDGAIESQINGVTFTPSSILACGYAVFKNRLPVAGTWSARSPNSWRRIHGLEGRYASMAQAVTMDIVVGTFWDTPFLPRAFAYIPNPKGLIVNLNETAQAVKSMGTSVYRDALTGKITVSGFALIGGKTMPVLWDNG